MKHRPPAKDRRALKAAAVAFVMGLIVRWVGGYDLTARGADAGGTLGLVFLIAFVAFLVVDQTPTPPAPPPLP